MAGGPGRIAVLSKRTACPTCRSVPSPRPSRPRRTGWGPLLLSLPPTPPFCFAFASPHQSERFHRTQEECLRRRSFSLFNLLLSAIAATRLASIHRGKLHIFPIIGDPGARGMQTHRFVVPSIGAVLWSHSNSARYRSLWSLLFKSALFHSGTTQKYIIHNIVTLIKGSLINTIFIYIR